MKLRIIMTMVFTAFILLISVLLMLFNISSANNQIMQGSEGQYFHCP